VTDESSRPVVDLSTRQPTPIPPGGRHITMGADIEIVEGHLKLARGGSSTAAGGAQDESQMFEFYSDEPPFLGGEGRHPQPLLYLAAGIGL
jgi:hypothetical protein